MSIQEQFAACTAKGYKADAGEGKISGLESGIAFLARPEAGTLEMSVNIPEKHLEKLRARLAGADAAFAGAAVEHHNFGIRVTLSGMADLPADTLIRFLQTAAAEASRLIGVTYDDKYVKDGEPFSAYVRGFFGALLGAIVGILPWVLVTNLVHIQFGYLGFLISIGSFYGYCRFRGAHSTRFAVAVIVFFSLAVMFLPDGIQYFIWAYRSGEFSSIGAMLAYSFSPSNLVSMLPGMGFGLISNIIGLLAIRGRVLSYTHETQYLRRSRKK